MATMDIIKLHGGNPANFLDVGGSAEEDGVNTNLYFLFLNFLLNFFSVLNFK